MGEETLIIPVDTANLRKLRRTVNIFFAACGAAILVLTTLFTIAIIGLHTENQRLDDLTAFNRNLITNVCAKYPVACSVVGGSPAPTPSAAPSGVGAPRSTPRPSGAPRTAPARTAVPTATARPTRTPQATRAPAPPTPTPLICVGPLCI